MSKLSQTTSIATFALLAGLSCLVGCNDKPSSTVTKRNRQPVIPNANPTLPSTKLIRPNVTPSFTDVASAAGIQFTFFNDAVPERFFLPEVMGGGAAWFDFDRDGRLDLMLVNGAELRPDKPPSANHPHELYQNLGGGKFRKMIDSGIVGPGYGQGTAVADFDADGFSDLYLSYYGQDRLFHNQGDGTFEDVTEQAGISENLWGSGVVWVDLDGDFNLDLYVANYLDVTFANHHVCQYENHGPGYCGPGDFDAVADLVLRSLGDGRFEDVTERFGFVAADGKGLGVVAADFNDDLRPEIYVANDMAPNFLFTWAGAPSVPLYKEIAFEHGCAVSESGLHEASMGVVAADFDNDRRPDIFLTHFFGQKDTLYRNLGKLYFVDDSRRSRIAATGFHTLGFGACAIDYDRDSWADLMITNGHVLGKHHVPNEMEPQILKNNRGRFEDVSQFAGPYFLEKRLGRALAAADYDNDGDSDVVITHLETPVALLRNDTEAGQHYLGLSLHTQWRTPPVGGRVVVRSGGNVQTLPITSGGSYLSTHDGRFLVGVAGPKVDVEIHWTTGRVDRFVEMESDKYWRIEEQIDSPTTQVLAALP